MIEVRELKSKKIQKYKTRNNKISNKIAFNKDMDKVNWVKLNRIINKASKVFKKPGGFHLKTYKKGKVRYEFITPKKKKSEDIIVYFHGGGFVTGNATLVRDYTFSLADITGRKVCSVDYPLAPLNKITDCYEAISIIYDSLCEKYPESNFILSGTSAGGGLALGLTEKLIRENKKVPTYIILNSPLIDLSGMYKPVNEIEYTICELGCKKAISKLFLGKYKKKDYLASPLLFINHKIPKVFVSVDNNESLFTDSYVLYNKCLENNVNCKLMIYKNTYHGFQTLGKKTKETTELLKLISDFIEN